MATLPSPNQVAGEHIALYSALYESVKKPDGNIPAMDAAKLLQKSGLPSSVLSRIWEMSDVSGKGYLNKPGFFVALKLISLAQAGGPVEIAATCSVGPPPNLGTGPIPVPPSVPKAIDWSISPSKKSEYEALFDSLQPNNGYIPGNKVKSLLMDSKLHVDTLCKIWDLADMDKDGSLDKYEFSIAMHLVYKALEKYVIPNTLPPELVQAKTQQQPEAPAPVPWVVSQNEKVQYDKMFDSADIDKDGFVSGQEIRGVFLQSGLPQADLAAIWALADISQCGKLNSEQFALAMWLIKRKLAGNETPVSLSSEMVPPSFRTANSNNNVQAAAPAAAPPVEENPEIAMMLRDIDEVRREREALEREVSNKECDVATRSAEATSLQGEVETLAATLKQLESQKAEASRRLGELSANVIRLSEQAEKQGAVVAEAEAEITGRVEQAERLRSEEARLTQLEASLASQATDLDERLREAQLALTNIRAIYEELEEFHRELEGAGDVVSAALKSGDFAGVDQAYLCLEPIYEQQHFRRVIDQKPPQQNPVQEEIKTEPVPQTNGWGDSNSNAFNDPFSARDKFNNSNGFAAAFGQNAQEDPFGSAFGSSGGSAFGSGGGSAFGGSSFGAPVQAADPFASFEATGNANNDSDGADPFGCEPFAAPALPPKNKQPPPRPAPPRPQPPKSPVPPAAQPNASSGGDSFADFSNFGAAFPKSESQNKLDFTEDPFSDYRYEDTFGNEDPFSKEQSK